MNLSMQSQVFYFKVDFHENFSNFSTFYFSYYGVPTMFSVVPGLESQSISALNRLISSVKT